MARFWYIYNGVTDPFNASSYQLLEAPNKPKCKGGSQICAIYATGSATNVSPNPLSHNIQQYISAALSSGEVPQPNGFGLKYYVYLRN